MRSKAASNKFVREKEEIGLTLGSGSICHVIFLFRSIVLFVYKFARALNEIRNTDVSR